MSMKLRQLSWFFLVYVLLVGIAPAYAEEKGKWTFIGFTKSGSLWQNLQSAVCKH
jgi:hypothetical protein